MENQENQPNTMSEQEPAAAPASDVAAPMQTTVTPAVPVEPVTPPVAVENKNYVKTVILSNAFGVFGVDRFYLGKTGTGIAKLLTGGGVGIWYLIDLIMVIFGHARAKGSDQPLEGTEEYKPFMVKMFWIILAISLAYLLFALAAGIMSLSFDTYVNTLSGGFL